MFGTIGHIQQMAVEGGMAEVGYRPLGPAVRAVVFVQTGRTRLSRKNFQHCSFQSKQTRVVDEQLVEC